MQNSRKINAYNVVAAFDSATLLNDINEAMRDGWEPYGYPFTLDGQVVQAFVKYKEEVSE